MASYFVLEQHVAKGQEAMHTACVESMLIACHGFTGNESPCQI